MISRKLTDRLLLGRSPGIRHCFIAAATILLGVAACSLPVADRPTPIGDAHQRQHPQLTRYQLRGSLIFRTPRYARYARFNWQQQATNHYQLRLTHPLGQTLLLISYQAGALQLLDHQGNRYQGEQAKQLLQQQSGFHWPMDALAKWLIGIPGPQDQVLYDGQRRLQQLCPRGYPQLTIHYRAYRQQDHLLLPSQLNLQFQDQQITLNITHFTKLSTADP